MYLASLALSYEVAFTGATLSIGRSLSDAGTPRGYQDAITPPYSTTLAILVYAFSIGGIIYGVWAFGWLTGLGVAVGLFVAMVINGALITPKSDSQHFRNLIMHSMVNRHADYLKSGDALRASVMAELLEKLGVPVNELVAQIKKANDV